MATYYLLLGAGFSRNWGGWLATEAFEYLIGCRQLQSSPDIIRLLWKHRLQGGFEDTLSELQDIHRRSPSAENREKLNLVQRSIRQMFKDMNRSFLGQGFDFGNHVKDFLTGFDAIFTLNQDVLLERHYLGNGFPIGGGRKRWSGAGLPGVTLHGLTPNEWSAQEWLDAHWYVRSEIPQNKVKGSQPIYKLHGSSQWYRDEDRDGVMVMGGQKVSAIESDPLLQWYKEEFESALEEPNSKLMIIGYGFRDQHINNAIKQAGNNGLKIYNISPEGADAWSETPGPGNGFIKGENYLEPFLIGASRRPLKDVLTTDSIENLQMMRFFAE